MPSKSKKQHNFMEAVAHSKKFSEEAGVPQKVGKEFSKADERQRRSDRRAKQLDKWANK